MYIGHLCNNKTLRKIFALSLITPFLSVLLFSFVCGALTDGLIVYYSFDVDKTWNDSTINNFDLAASGTAFVNTSAKLGTGAYHQTASGAFLSRTLSVPLKPQDWTICYWMYPTIITYRTMFETDSAAAWQGIGIYSDVNNHRMEAQVKWDGSSSTTINPSPVELNEWKFICFAYDSITDKWLGYVNATLASNVSSNSANMNYGTSDTFRLGANYGLTSYIGKIDEFGFWNRTLTTAEIAQLYNNNIGLAYPFLTTPTLTLSSNLINNTQNYESNTLSFFYNGTFAGSYTTTFANCSFYQNDVFNRTIDVNLSQNNKYNISIGDYSDWFNLSFNCSNAEVSYNAGKYFYRIDTVKPVIKSSFINKSEYYVDNAQTFYSNCSDSNLFATNITVFNRITGANIYSKFVQNLTPTFYENYSTYLYDTIGNYSYNIECWDSHTNIIIPSYRWEKVEYTVNTITYKGIRFNNDVELITDDYSKLNDFVLIKNSDRFLFAFNFTQANFTFSMFIKANNTIYLPSSKYNGHFVINNKHWVDFESDDVSNLRIDYLSNYDLYRIRFNPNKKIVVFNSIGDLNYNSLTYFFTVVNEPETPALNLTTLEALTAQQLNETKKIADGVNMIGYIIWLILNIVMYVFSNDERLDVIGFISSFLLGLYTFAPLMLFAWLSLAIALMFMVRVSSGSRTTVTTK